MSVRDIILARPSEDVAELAGLINNSPRRRRMRELELDDLQHLLQVRIVLDVNFVAGIPSCIHTTVNTIRVRVTCCCRLLAASALSVQTMLGVYCAKCI